MNHNNVSPSFWWTRASLSGFSLVLVCVLMFDSEQTFGADDKPSRVFRAGAIAVDVSPVKFPVIINGNMNEVLASEVFDRLHARALVLDDGTNLAAIVIVDSC